MVAIIIKNNALNIKNVINKVFNTHTFLLPKTKSFYEESKIIS